jgi:hypothetical protein
VIGLPERLLIWFAAALMVFGAGWAGRGIYADHKQVKVLQKDKRETSQNIEHAVQQSEKIDADVHADGARIEGIRAQIVARMTQPIYKEVHHDPVHDSLPQAADAVVPESPVPVRDPVLDAGTVRLLNAARSGTELRAAGSGDEQKPAAPRPAG